MSEPLNRYWRLTEIIARTGLCSRTIYRRMAAAEFPASRSLGGGAVAWWADDVMAWMESRPIVPPASGHKPGQRPKTDTQKTAVSA